MQFDKPVLGFAAFSGVGKTTLLEKLIPLLSADGIRVAVIKHAHHNFDIDHPGKDSYRLRKAGAEQMLVASNQRWALMTEQKQAGDPQLSELLSKIDTNAADLIIVEGFKHVPFSKIELHRPVMKKPLLYKEDRSIIAVAHDSPVKISTHLPQLDLNAPADIKKFIVNWMTKAPAEFRQINY